MIKILFEKKRKNKQKINTREITGRKLSRSNRMLVVEAYHRGVQFEILPNKRFRMTHDNRRYLIRRGIISHANNTRLANRVTTLKEVTSRMLRSRSHSAPENVVFSKDDLERAWNWAKPILPVVLKPYNGIMGRLVFVNIDNYEEFKDCFSKIGSEREHVLIEKFVEGEEFRFTYVRNEIVAIAQRVPCHVVGDDENTIEQLIHIKNEMRKKRKNPIHKKLKLDRESKRVLSRQSYTENSIPNQGEIVYLRENSNISTGGDAIDVTDEISNDIKERVRKAMRSIPGLRVAGVDVIINEDEIHILEINAHPMLNIHHFPWEGKSRDVIGKVIDGMFPETKKIIKTLE